MCASRALAFILLTGVVFGVAAAATSWLNDAAGWLVFLAYVLGGNVGVSLAGALVYFQRSRLSDD